MYILPAILFGVFLGSNDSANIFGPSVEMGILRYRLITVVSAISIFFGAIFGGKSGIETISSFSNMNIYFAVLSTISAVLTMVILSKLGIPSSSSQAIVGGILGAGILNNYVNIGILFKLLVAWVLTPIGGMFFGFLMYKVLSVPFNKIRSIQLREKLIVLFTLVIGAYASFSLGANNVANVTGVFAKKMGIDTAVFIGGLSISVGALFSNKRVMYTISKRIIELDYFSSAISVLGQAITVWLYSLVGIPVSVSQAIVGAVIGAGFAKGSKLVNKRIIVKIALTWIVTPTFSAFFTILLYYITNFFD
ncbi:phosphate permease [Thermosipho melanesiensis]|uniref:Phosphate transporter n=2 Tax=Thermosipho melanesiensis TaxID=46541 RepID=A6LKY9_THEM4|nr:inorganic phosphate transporter [Thermosipho melanesiensis]ABR30590.1 phosphate transporter [Thermosipho melanesiensis BI429]APT73734.1 phosphate permease [Thermosipho melanesiensis]OOC35671.1 phosphate permease [Thermosipho melanesiensis]OOC38970.1 phosphate permease [Thermosipho melanesiensis]OOC39118.1 phosphate permease [Thermosipho melanesiensis]